MSLLQEIKQENGKLTIILDDELKRQIRIAAAQTGHNISDFVREALKKELARRGNQLLAPTEKLG